MEMNYIACREGRLSTILRQDMHLSTGLMNRLKWQDSILVDGIPRHTDYLVQPGNTVTCLLDERIQISSLKHRALRGCLLEH